jgi:hypothetical protein
MKRGDHHSADARRRIGEGIRVAMASPEVRKRISERTRAAMAAPEVRQKISERTKEAIGSLPELRRLRDAWGLARPSVRRAFFEELLAPLFDGGGQP